MLPSDAMYTLHVHHCPTEEAPLFTSACEMLETKNDNPGYL